MRHTKDKSHMTNTEAFKMGKCNQVVVAHTFSLALRKQRPTQPIIPKGKGFPLTWCEMSIPPWRVLFTVNKAHEMLRLR